MKKDDIRDELSNHGVLKVAWFKVFYYFLVRFVAPVALIVSLAAPWIKNLVVYIQDLVVSIFS